MPATIASTSWLNLNPVGDVIQGTRFIPLKTPISKQTLETEGISKEQCFTPTKLVRHIHLRGKQLGMVIDLSSSARYYDPKELKTLGVKEYVKLKTKKHTLLDGHQKFKEIVNDFLEKNPDPDVVIGVHCYHGLQRTSYMICSYMCTELKIDLKNAIDAFEIARKHGIDNGRKWLLEDAKNGFKKRE